MIRFFSSDERNAWDRFLAGALAAGLGVTASVEVADACVIERRKRHNPKDVPYRMLEPKAAEPAEAEKP